MSIINDKEKRRQIVEKIKKNSSFLPITNSKGKKIRYKLKKLPTKNDVNLANVKKDEVDIFKKTNRLEQLQQFDKKAEAEKETSKAFEEEMKKQKSNINTTKNSKLIKQLQQFDEKAKIDQEVSKMFQQELLKQNVLEEVRKNEFEFQDKIKKFNEKNRINNYQEDNRLMLKHRKTKLPPITTFKKINNSASLNASINSGYSTDISFVPN